MDVDFLVTGGAGFIGCAVAEKMKDTGATIVAADKMHPQVHPNGERPADLPAYVNLRMMDICDASAWDRLLSRFRPRAILHFAAETGTGQSLDFPVRHTHTNVTGTAEMLEALDRAHHKPDQIILSSSRAVYGEGAWMDPQDQRLFYPGHRSHQQLENGKFEIVAPSGAIATPVNHSASITVPQPTNIYGATKLAQENLLSAWCTARGVPLSILRFQNVYGIGQSPHNPYTGIIALFHRIAAKSSPIPLYEDGNIGRDFVYIDDVADAVIAAAKRPPLTLRTVDVGRGKVITIFEAATAIAKLYDAPKPEISGAFRYGDVRWAVCDASVLSCELKVRPSIDFDEGNRRLSRWLIKTGVITR